MPAEPEAIIRAYDKAGTEGAGKRTAGVKMARLKPNNEGIKYVIMDCIAGQWSVGRREQIIKETAINDGVRTKIAVEMEPGSGGKESALATQANLDGFSVVKRRPSGEKTVRAEPLATQVEIGAVAVLNRQWTEDYLEEMELFPSGKFSDRVDASTLGHNELSKMDLFDQDNEQISAGIQVKL